MEDFEHYVSFMVKIANYGTFKIFTFHNFLRICNNFKLKSFFSSSYPGIDNETCSNHNKELWRITS